MTSNDFVTCPPIDELGPYAHELFPGCEPPPLRYKAVLCGDQRCARPCEWQWSVSGSAIPAAEVTQGSETFTYDADGRLATATSLEHVRACRYDDRGRLLEDCSGPHYEATRDASGKILAIQGLALSYDAGGRLVRIGDNELTYDGDQRISGYGTRRYEWQGDKLVAEYFGTNPTPLRYVYDARGYLVKVTDETGPIEFTYDGNRLVSVVSTTPGERRTSKFRYDCR